MDGFPAGRPRRAPGRPRRRPVSDAQLGWVQDNRRPAARTRLLAEALAREDLSHAADDRVARQIFEAITAVVDDHFRRCCKFDELRGRELVLLVEGVDLRYDIRTRWYAVLKAQLERCVPQRRIDRITFRAGSGGATFTPPRG